MLSFVIKTFFGVSVLQRTLLLRCSFLFLFFQLRMEKDWRVLVGFCMADPLLLVKNTYLCAAGNTAGVFSDTVFIYTDFFLQLYMAVSGYTEQVLQ